MTTTKSAYQLGYQGPKGDPGESAYRLWLDQGNTGTVADFLLSLKGPKGDPGTGGTGNLNAVYPLSYDVPTSTLTVDQQEITDGGNF